MRATPTGVHWAIVAACTAVATGVLSRPETLPYPLRSARDEAVGGVANLLLWCWGVGGDELCIKEPVSTGCRDSTPSSVSGQVIASCQDYSGYGRGQDRVRPVSCRPETGR